MDINAKAFVKQLAKQHHCTQIVAKEFLDDFFETILQNLRDGNSVTLYGIGRFEITRKRSCLIPDNKNGGMMKVPARFIPRFLPGTKFMVATKEAEMYGNIGADYHGDAKV